MPAKFYIKDNEFIIEDYNNAKPFASFLPAVAGFWGKPLWVFYVNRAQAISSFGTKDKNGAILEFVAANKAYRLTPLQGFRTFLKINNKFYEPFQNKNHIDSVKQQMYITSYLLKLVEVNKNIGLEITVEYFTIPNENLPALARILYIKNVSSSPQTIECLDGLPMIIPYGTTDYFLKNISRLAEGWFSGVIYIGRNKIPVYKLAVEPEDRPEIVEIKSANFYYGFYSDGEKDYNVEDFVVDPDIIFGQRKDFSLPDEFINHSNFRNIPEATAKNKTPCGMGYFKTLVKKDHKIAYFSIVGNVQKLDQLESFINKASSNKYFLMKKEENKEIITSIGNKILTKSSSPEFDCYCQQTFIDNLLRGGYPITLGKGKFKKNYYIYSRIHGDMEREYNNFVIMPEYFSQGNGNYRDVCQNRRNDVFFNTYLTDETFIYFMNLIQTDGFNPLSLLVSKFRIINKTEFVRLFKRNDKKRIAEFISSDFTLGEFFNFLEDKNIKLPFKKEKMVEKIMQFSEKTDVALPGTGYWSDHWHYNIDLLESFLSVYPEELEDILLNKKVFTFYDNPLIVLPRSEKYVLYNGKPRQLNATTFSLEKQKMIDSRKEDKNIVRKRYGKGSIYKTTLIGKLICLVVNKFASIDPEGIGVEMEADRPNWCDALNGLPGLFGSSIAETLELKRLIKFILDSLDKIGLKQDKEIKTAEEILDFLLNLERVTLKYSGNNFKHWDETHKILEEYRRKTLFGLSGKEKKISIEKLKEILKLFLNKIEKGISKAIDKKTGIIYTNFENKVVKYKILRENKKIKKNKQGFVCIKPLKFKSKPLPFFLEGPVHYLRTIADAKKARDFHKALMKTDLYDKKLKMFKINAPLENTAIDIGRIKVFTPGWLENESIWLHMEYKYLLELLRNGLAREFWQVAKDVLVPFLDPNIYGRSIFENVSFIVSSAHPEKNLHGQGFVARLSGSTAEFISMWISITSGLKPFYIDNDQLNLKFSPQIPSWMFSKPDNSFMFKFLGKIDVIYYNPSCKNTYGKNRARISKIKLTYLDRKKVTLIGDLIPPPYSYDIRKGEVKEIEITLQ